MLYIRNKKIRLLLLSASVGVTFSQSHISKTEASTLVFQGQNAGLFPTANPNAVSILMNSVPKEKATAPTTSTGMNTAMMIENAVVSQISTRIYNQIFNGTALSGSYDLGGGNAINYMRSDGNITITLINATSGTTTITIPDAGS